jgi:hypothetical protein
MPVTMDTKPPKVTLSHAQRAIHPGGSGVVLYTVSEQPGRHGVMIDDPSSRDSPPARKIPLSATSPCHGTPKPEKPGWWPMTRPATRPPLPLPAPFKKEPIKKDTITISEQFLQKKIPEFEQHYPEMKGTLLEKYLYVNNQVRQSNPDHCQGLRRHRSQQLWSDRFLRMPGSGRAGFADQRTYLYNGTAIDTQTHLGVDIASLERAEIRAANRGKVVFADYLGIYGNMVIIDHGQGFASLYSHLSSIDTTVGAAVEKDQPIGRSGATGMAGGDHLHFSMLVHGIFVTPIQWWDQHWIDVNIKTALNAL